jgi:hypothetical protein
MTMLRETEITDLANRFLDEDATYRELAASGPCSIGTISNIFNKALPKQDPELSQRVATRIDQHIAYYTKHRNGPT